MTTEQIKAIRGENRGATKDNTRGAELYRQLTRHGYRLLRYNADQQPRASNTWPFLFARRSLPWVGI